jgi:hypothetical protein
MTQLRKRGPEPFRLDRAEFEKLVSYQCTQEEVACFFDISVDTLERSVYSEYGEKLAEVWDKKKSFGRIKLKKKQMEMVENGNVTMAIFLGKYLLGQTDVPTDQALMEAMQKSGLNRDQAVNLLLNGPTQLKVPDKKSFLEFIEAAGYPVPYPKQIEMSEFGLVQFDNPRLLLGARGYGKTDYVTILRVAYKVYLLGAAYSCLIVTKEKKRAGAIISEIATALRANGVVLEKENSSCVRVQGRIGKDHSVEGLSIRSGFRGRHPDEAIMDDPVTEEDVSQATREQVERKYNELLKLTKNVLIIGQPAHNQDLYAKLRPLLNKLEVPFGQIPELDHDLEAMRLAGVDSRSIEMSYHLRIPKDGTNPFDGIKYIDSFPVGDPTRDTAIAFIDPSHEGGDYTALTIMKGYFAGMAIVGFCWKKGWNHCLDEMVPHLKKYNVKKLGFETNSLGDMPITMLMDLLKNTGIGVIGRRSNNNKHSRIVAAGAYSHLLHLSKESDTTYTNQVVQYEYKATNDDAPDSLATGLEWIGLIKGKL